VLAQSSLLKAETIMTGNKSVTILPERPDSTDAMVLIQELEATLDPLYPSESRHGYSVEKLIAEQVAFFVLRYDGAPAGCGGVKLFGMEYGEIKRIYVRHQYRGLGLSKLVMEYLAGYARVRGVPILRLETGIYQPEAIGLYERLGYRRIGPFGEYKHDPLSIYFEKKIL
jgi:putative acetyltransferase